ncbi:MAG TPA: tyramine oxidase [Acidimicrobiaceae bacterium]|nr:tyramine oxidase [Acidimicrobiaceae bacterium]
MHPLSMMTADELNESVSVLRSSGRINDSSTFHGCCIYEPTKQEVASWQPGDSVDRRLDLVVRHEGEVYEARVSITRGEVDRWEAVPNVVPRVGFVELFKVMDACRNDSDFQKALKDRGIDDPSKVQIDPWPTGDYGFEFEDGRRVQRCIAFYRPNPSDNGYAFPIDGLMVHVDVDSLSVLHIEDFGTWPLPTERGNYDVDSVVSDYGPIREDLKPVEITQPEGASFSVDDNEITWQRWRFRMVVDDTEGLVLHRVTYTQDGIERPVIDRASLAEMVVPYGDTRPSQTFKHALDSGEYGLGMTANSLTLGCDCLGEIFYLDAVQMLDDGSVVTTGNAICIHEEDFGIGWKHTDMNTGEVEVRRSRRLVVSSISTVGNYEYGFFWYFHLDGSIKLEIKLTGILTTRAHAEGDDLTFARLVAPNVAGPIHQHLFCVRLDMAIDGNQNNIVEVNTEALPAGPANPHNTAFAAREKLLENEHSAMRNTNSASSRYWRIENSEKTNRLGRPTAYRLLPSSTATMFAAEDSPHAQRAMFAKHNLWVTPTTQSERYAAGDYPTQRNAGEGLPKFTANNRSVADTDLTVWHTFGLTHDVRVEDYPVMPTEYAGFMLVPDGFFDRNPAIDVAPSQSNHCH